MCSHPSQLRGTPPQELSLQRPQYQLLCYLAGTCTTSFNNVFLLGKLSRSGCDHLRAFASRHGRLSTIIECSQRRPETLNASNATNVYSEYRVCRARGVNCAMHRQMRTTGDPAPWGPGHLKVCELPNMRSTVIGGMQTSTRKAGCCDAPHGNDKAVTSLLTHTLSIYIYNNKCWAVAPCCSLHICSSASVHAVGAWRSNVALVYPFACRGAGSLPMARHRVPKPLVFPLMSYRTCANTLFFLEGSLSIHVLELGLFRSLVLATFPKLHQQDFYFTCFSAVAWFPYPSAYWERIQSALQACCQMCRTICSTAASWSVWCACFFFRCVGCKNKAVKTCAADSQTSVF